MEQAFFDLGTRADPLLQVLANKLEAYNRHHPFLDRIASAAGMPQWQQAMRIAGERTDLMAAQAKDARSTKAYFVPFVKKSTRRISALLMVRVKGADTTYKMIYRQHYRGYGFAERPGRWNARKVMLLFAMMEEQLFGHKNFMVNDGRIMGGKPGERYLVSFEPDATGSDPNNQKNGLVTTCKKYKSCFTVGGPYVCATRQICKTEFVYDEPEEAQNFFDDDPGNGGGSEEEGFILVPPCPDQNNTEQTGWQLPNDSFYGIDPCDETAGWEEEIKNQVKDPCLKQMVDDVLAAGGENYIANFINSAFGRSEDIDLYFKDRDLGFGPGTDAGRTDPNYFRLSGYCRIDITLNSRTLPASSKEYITATIFHEAIHAWIILTQTEQNAANNVSHETMAATGHVNRMADALRSMFPNLAAEDAFALSWGGLEHTSAWQNQLTEEKRFEIGQRIDFFKMGRAGTKCN